MNDLKELLAKVEAGDANPREVFEAFDTPCQDVALQQRAYDAESAYNGSLDAAKALHDAVLEGWRVDIYIPDEVFMESPSRHVEIRSNINGKCANNPARAWLIAILKALTAQHD